MEDKLVNPDFVELVALVYHEGRNVKSLFRHNAASKKTFGHLADLPPDPGPAWDRLIAVQQKAASAASAAEAENVFKEDLGCSLADLAAIFDHAAWHRVPGAGGARWAAITKSVIDLGVSIDKKDEAATAKLIDEIRLMHHNTGSVKDKLAKLKATRRS